MTTSTWAGREGGKNERGCKGRESDDEDVKIEAKFRGKVDIKLDLEDFLGKLKEKHGKNFSRTCGEACFKTPECRFDPHEHWSYCKFDHEPQVCFGLYHVPKHSSKSAWGWGEGDKFGRLCYEPNSTHCPERFPLKCEKKNRKERRKEWEDDSSSDEEY